MIDFLLGVPGRLKTISDYLTTNWTATRAAKVDNLDAAITTRAPASTALSTSVWTSALATMIGTINTKVDTLIASAGPTTKYVAIAIHRNTIQTTTHYTCPAGKTALVKSTTWTWSDYGSDFTIGPNYTFNVPNTSSGSVTPPDKVLTAGQTITVTSESTTSFNELNANLTISEANA